MKNQFEINENGSVNVLFTEEIFNAQEFFKFGSVELSGTKEKVETFTKSEFKIMNRLDVEFRKIIMKKGENKAGYIRHFGYWETDEAKNRRFVKLTEIKRKASA